MASGDEDLASFAALQGDLRRGNLRHLETHLAAISAIGEAIARERGDQAELARLRTEAERSRDLLAAAAGGVRAVLRRLGEAGSPTAVYAPDGSRSTSGASRPGTESRA